MSPNKVWMIKPKNWNKQYFFFTNIQLFFHDKCGEGFQSDGNGEEANKVDDAVEGVEHYHREVSASTEEEPLRYRLQTCLNLHRKLSSSLFSTLDNFPHSKHQRIETNFTDSVSVVRWPPSWTFFSSTTVLGAIQRTLPSYLAPVYSSSSHMTWTEAICKYKKHLCKFSSQ